MCCSSLAAADLPRAQRSARSDEGDGGNDQDREMDPDEARDYADQGPLPDKDMEEDNEILATLLKHMPSCMNADDIEQLLQEIPVHPSAVVPVRTVQEAVAAGDLRPLDVDAANVFSRSERILQDHVRKHRVLGGDANGSVSFELAQIAVGPDRVPISLFSTLMPHTSSTGSPSDRYTVSCLYLCYDIYDIMHDIL